VWKKEKLNEESEQRSRISQALNLMSRWGPPNSFYRMPVKPLK
jgi:hypothetical protein